MMNYNLCTSIFTISIILLIIIIIIIIKIIIIIILIQLIIKISSIEQYLCEQYDLNKVAGHDQRLFHYFPQNVND